MINTKITQATGIPGGARVVVSVTHGVTEKVSAEHVHTGVRNAFKNKMIAVAGSFRTIDMSPIRTLLVGHVTPTRDAIPVPQSGNIDGMVSVSRNMYRDDEDNLWSLRQSEDGNFLVRANGVDNPAEIQELMKACCSTVRVGSDNHYFQSLSRTAETIDNIQSGDYVSYVQGGELRFGVAAASVIDENENETLYVVAGNDNVDAIGRDQLIDGVTIGTTKVEGVELVVPDELASLSSSNLAQDLLTFWQKVYGFNPTYFGKLEAIIRGHSFA
jgi:hypothetical protein